MYCGSASRSSASSTAASSTTPPREKFSTTAPRFIGATRSRVDQVARRVDKRHVQGDEVAVLEHVTELSALLDRATADSTRRRR